MHSYTCRAPTNGGTTTGNKQGVRPALCKVRVRQKQWSIAAGNGRFEPHPLIPWGVPAPGDPHAPPMILSPPQGGRGGVRRSVLLPVEREGTHVLCRRGSDKCFGNLLESFWNILQVSCEHDAEFASIMQTLLSCSKIHKPIKASRRCIPSHTHASV